LKTLPLHETNANDETNQISSTHNDENIVNQSSGELTFLKNNQLIDSTTSTATSNNSGCQASDLLDEHERRRNSERFLKTKSPSERKSPRRSRKSSPIVYQHETSNSSMNDKIDDEAKENVIDNSNQNSNDDDEIMPKSKPQYPWEFVEDKPVVCQRFAENTFDHAHYSISKFIKQDHDLVKFNIANDDEDIDKPNYHSHHNYDDNGKKHHSSYRSFLSVEKSTSDKAHSPIRSSGGGSAGDSIGANNGSYLTPDDRIKQINKRLTSLKKKISVYEERFENNYGYRPSHADKSNDKNIKNYIAEIHRLRKEKSQIKADPMTAMGYKNKFDDSIPVEKKMTKINDTLQDIEKVCV
jgi:hypothetical protein